MISAEFITQPISGRYDELIFDTDNEWRINYWCWVLINVNEIEWVACLRGTAVKLALNKHANQIAVLTDYGLFIIDYRTRIAVYRDEQTDVSDIKELNDQPGFLLASWANVELLDNEFRLTTIETEEFLDDVKFLEYEDNKLLVEVVAILKDYSLTDKKGYIDLSNRILLVD